MSFTPKSRLEKIICGVSTTAKSRIEKAVEMFMRGRFYRVSPVLGENVEHKNTLTFTETAAEVYEAIVSGKTVILNMDTGDGYTAEGVGNIACLKLHSVDAEVTAYSFRMVNHEGEVFYAENLLGSAPVVLTAE